MSTAAHAQAGRDRARHNRLKAARERRLHLDPDQLVRERASTRRRLTSSWRGGPGRGPASR